MGGWCGLPSSLIKKELSELAGSLKLERTAPVLCEISNLLELGMFVPRAGTL